MRSFPLSREQVRDIRFEYSPLYEVLLSRLALRWPARHSQHAPWIERASRADADPDFATHRRILDDVIRPYGWLPAFLLPAPERSPRTWETELAAIGATSPELVRSDLSDITAAGPQPAVVLAVLEDPGHGIKLIAAALDAWWTRAVEPVWSRVAAVLDADIEHRQHTLHKRGPRMLFSSIDRRLRWDGTTLHLPSESGVVATHPTSGLTLLPSLFLDHRPMASVDSPSRRMLFYPARNVATTWSSVAAPPLAVAQLLGASRAQILSLATKPHTTTEFAGLAQLQSPTVSFHLAILRDAGLVQSQRVGRDVLYHATPLGLRLLRAPMTPASRPTGARPRTDRRPSKTH
jgi:DNA-binding transcriptional ArsR family regulator